MFNMFITISDKPNNIKYWEVDYINNNIKAILMKANNVWELYSLFTTCSIQWPIVKHCINNLLIFKCAPNSCANSSFYDSFKVLSLIH